MNAEFEWPPWQSWRLAPKTGETLIVSSERFGVILGRWNAEEKLWDFWEPGEDWGLHAELDQMGAKPTHFMPWPKKFERVSAQRIADIAASSAIDTSDIPEVGREFFEKARVVVPDSADAIREFIEHGEGSADPKC